jgi:hypothetical protein
MTKLAEGGGEGFQSDFITDPLDPVPIPFSCINWSPFFVFKTPPKPSSNNWVHLGTGPRPVSSLHPEGPSRPKPWTLG